MPSQESSRRNCRQTQELDLRDRKSYVKSVDWVRRNVVFRRGAGSVQQLNVLVFNGGITLYMNPANHYIMGFRGADRVLSLAR